MANQGDSDRQETEAGARVAQMIFIGIGGAMLVGFVLWVLIQMAPLTPEEDSLTHMGIGFLLAAMAGMAYAAIQKAISSS